MVARAPRRTLLHRLETYFMRQPLLAPFWRLGHFLALTLRKAQQDAVFLTSGALAFVTLLSLVPLLVAFSFFGSRLFTQHEDQILALLVQVLPSPDASVIETLKGFLHQAEALQGWALAAFIASAIAAFGTVEAALTRIWNLPRARPFRVRILSFTLLLVWGPVLVGAMFSSPTLLRQRAGLRVLLEESLLLSLLPHVASVLGLTLFYWLVPYTTVRFRAALAGGLSAAILLELLRQGFGAYVGLLANASLVYGSFTFILFFAVSIQLTWATVLYGGVISYCAQHYAALSRGLARLKPFQGRWVGLAAAAALAERFDHGTPVTSHGELADRLRLPPDILTDILAPLVEAGILATAEGRDRAYLLAHPPHKIGIDEILSTYDDASRCSFEALGHDLRHRLETLMTNANRLRAKGLAGATLSEIVEGPEETAELEGAESNSFGDEKR